MIPHWGYIKTQAAKSWHRRVIHSRVEIKRPTENKKRKKERQQMKTRRKKSIYR
jgi:hypothetical protein